MLSVLFLDVRRVGTGYFLLYYLLNYSGNYIASSEGEKTYDFECNITKQSLLNTIAKVINSLGSSVDDLVIVTEPTQEDIIGSILTEVEAYLYVNRGTPFDVISLGENLGLGKSLSLYDIYSLYFGTPDNISHMEMVDRVFTHCYIGRETNRGTFMTIFLRKRFGCCVLSCCWFSLHPVRGLSCLGKKYGYFDLVSDNYISVHNFIRELQFSLTETGISMSNITVIYASEADYTEIQKFFNKWGILFKCGKSVEIFDSIKHTLSPVLLDVIDVGNNFVRVFTSTVKNDLVVSAELLMDACYSLSQSRGISLGVSGFEVDGNARYYKDFSSDINSGLSVRNGFSYCVVLDCEGTSTGGCSEVGGLICAYDKINFLKLETFYFKRRDFEEGMSNIVKSFEDISGRYLPVKGLPVYTYGNTDSHMIQQELQESTSRTVRRRLSKAFEFINIQPKVFDFVEKHKVSLDNRQLNTIAKGVGVSVIEPTHSALNDAKTLFNVMSVLHLYNECF